MHPLYGNDTITQGFSSTYRVRIQLQGLSSTAGPQPGSIAPLQQQALLYFMQRDDRNKQIAGGYLLPPGGHLGGGTPEPNLAKL